MMQKLLLLFFLLLFSNISALLFTDKNGCGEYKYRNNNTNKCESCHNTCRQCNGPGENQCIHCSYTYILCNTTTTGEGYYYCKPKKFGCDYKSLTTTTESNNSQSNGANVGRIIGFAAAVIGFIIVLFIIWLIRKIICRRRNNRNRRTIIEGGNLEMKPIVDLRKPEKEKFTTADSEISWNENDKISSGTYGNVYKGEYTNKDKSRILVAIKEARKPKSDEPYREFKIMLQIGIHPHIIPLITTKMDDNLILVLPLRKNNLSNYLEIATGITIIHKIRYCHQIAEGMRHLVSKQIVHCDLKASNILVVDENWIQICDFGRSQNFEGAKRTIGTVTHTAMELLDPLTGATNSEATDIWSFGVTIWEIFNDTRQKPYANISEDQFEKRLLAHLKKRNHLKTTHWPSEGKSLDLLPINAIMLKCWAREVDGRPNFQSLCEFFESKLPKT